MKPETNLACTVAKEAATLLYFGAEKEYKQAKLKAARTLGTKFLPSNLEVALELDKIAQENEGQTRQTQLLEMRRDALAIMRVLQDFSPVLIGSVWRGTARCGSDIDIAVYTDKPETVLSKLKAANVKIQKTQWTAVNKHGETLQSLHIYAHNRYSLEIVARSAGEAGQKRRCEVFGDQIKGLTLKELARLLESDPFARFVPE
ncbi:MAG: nucleotidyltransferase domain-containing protein [Candidatus Bathyarchaeota archaeon]|nr:nucleotidyltransferase domain-containing protein [Candidatus Bathyarchaeota archaeon]